MRLFDILGGDIVLKIKPGPDLARWHMPARRYGKGQSVAAGAFVVTLRPPRSRATAAAAVPSVSASVICMRPLAAPTTIIPGAAARRDKSGNITIPDRTTTMMAGQVNCW